MGASGLIIELLGRVAYSSSLSAKRTAKNMTPVPVPADLPQQVEHALAEDIGSGDLTAALIPAASNGWAAVISREAAIVCGVPYVDAVFARIDLKTRIHWKVAEGAKVEANQVLFEIQGPARSLLTGERTALNFLQLLSGTATVTHEFAARLKGTPCRLLDTRKTIPGLRTAQKYAVRVGGGHNHRIGLFDGILIKENHIMAAGSIARAVAAAKSSGNKVPVEVEVESLDELQQAIAAGADIALVDEFSLEDMAEAVTLNRAAPRPLKIEASGGVTLETIRKIAETGVDFISVGGITKHVRAIDLSMRFDWRR
jgi:nicotinate-nucleotide pyrophosphorylase (carboxylating)